MFESPAPTHLLHSSFLKYTHPKNIGKCSSTNTVIYSFYLTPKKKQIKSKTKSYTTGAKKQKKKSGKEGNNQFQQSITKKKKNEILKKIKE